MEKAAFLQLIQEHKGILYKISASYCRNAGDREDLMQEMIYELWRSAERFDSNYKFSTWMYRIALNVAISFYRKTGAGGFKVALDAGVEVADDGAAGSLGSFADDPLEERIELLQRFIASLGELDRALMILYLEERPYKEIAEILGLMVRSQPVMAISFGVFCVCTGIGIAGYIRDVSVIRAIDFSDNVLKTQRKLVGMQSTMVRDIRLAWLQMPFWASFFVSNEMIRAGGRLFYFVEVPIFACFVGLAVFLYFNITAENVERKKWVAALVRGAGSRRVTRAMELLKELEEFENEI